MLAQYKTRKYSSKSTKMNAQKKKTTSNETPSIKPDIAPTELVMDVSDSSSESSDDDQYEEILLRDFKGAAVENPPTKPDPVDVPTTPVKTKPKTKRSRTVVKKYYMSKQQDHVATAPKPDHKGGGVSYIGIGNNTQASHLLRNKIINF